MLLKRRFFLSANLIVLSVDFIYCFRRHLEVCASAHFVSRTGASAVRASD